MESVIDLLFLPAMPVLLYTVRGMLPGSAHLPRPIRMALLLAGTTLTMGLLAVTVSNRDWWLTGPAVLLVLMAAAMWV